RNVGIAALPYPARVCGAIYPLYLLPSRLLVDCSSAVCPALLIPRRSRLAVLPQLLEKPAIKLPIISSQNGRTLHLRRDVETITVEITSQCLYRNKLGNHVLRGHSNSRAAFARVFESTGTMAFG